jgi:hypothetical protein
MTVKEVTVNEWTCGGCSTVVYLPQGHLPDGIHAPIEIVEGGKTVSEGQVWACKEVCLRKAVKALISAVPPEEDSGTDVGTTDEPEGKPDPRSLNGEAVNA